MLHAYNAGRDAMDNYGLLFIVWYSAQPLFRMSEQGPWLYTNSEEMCTSAQCPVVHQLWFWHTIHYRRGDALKVVKACPSTRLSARPPALRPFD